MLTSRSTKILKFLLSQDKKIFLKDIAEYFKVSERTIRYELDKINEELNKENQILLNKGECFIENIEEIEKILNENTPYIPSAKERELFILA